MEKVIIDTDPGIDDALAISFAAKHPDVELVGLTTVFGNVPVPACSRNALSILEILGVADHVPVFQGAEKPLVVEPCSAEYVHGSNGLGDVAVPVASKEVQGNAVDFILQITRDFPGEISLLPIGPLTNIAMALEEDPSLVDRVKQIILMGGAIREGGNVTPLAEANIFNDPHAADQVLKASWPLTIVPLDVTRKTQLAQKELGVLQEKGGGVGEFCYKICQFYCDFYQRNWNYAGLCMHDVVTLMYLLHPEWFEMASGPVRVATEGVSIGHTIMDEEKRSDWMIPHWNDLPSHKACVGIEAEKVIELFLKTLTS